MSEPTVPVDGIALALEQIGDDEEAALSLFRDLRARFSWSGTIFMRSDLGAISDERWEQVRDSKEWEHLIDVLSERGNEYLEQAGLGYQIEEGEDLDEVLDDEGDGS